MKNNCTTTKKVVNFVKSSLIDSTSISTVDKMERSNFVLAFYISGVALIVILLWLYDHWNSLCPRAKCESEIDRNENIPPPPAMNRYILRDPNMKVHSKEFYHNPILSGTHPGRHESKLFGHSKIATAVTPVVDYDPDHVIVVQGGKIISCSCI